jgi:hypothetical protein
MDGDAGCTGETINTHKILVGKLRGRDRTGYLRIFTNSLFNDAARNSDYKPYSPECKDYLITMNWKIVFPGGGGETNSRYYLAV